MNEQTWIIRGLRLAPLQTRAKTLELLRRLANRIDRHVIYRTKSSDGR